MAFPEPLTIEPARLVVDGDKVIDAQHGDWYFQYDGVDETRHVYLQGAGVLDRLATGSKVVVAEIGFGTGLTYRTVQNAALEAEFADNLHYIGVEGRPLTGAQSAIANSMRPHDFHWSPSSETPRAGFVQEDDGLLLLHGDAVQALSRLEAQVDVWFLDGFSPAKNPSAWTAELFEQIARLSRPGARLATFTAAGDVRRGLEDVGFATAKREGWAKKREHLTAEFRGQWSPRLEPNNPLNIAGAGVAGLNLALAAKAQGWTPVIHGSGLEAQGSAVPTALINYRPSGDLGPLGHLRKAAFFALDDYLDAASLGVESVVTDEKLRRRWAEETEVAHQWIREDRVLVERALAIDTAAFKRLVLAQIDHRAEPLTQRAHPLALAAGMGAHDFFPLGLNANRGQQDKVALNTPFERPLNFGRLLLPVSGTNTAWLGASFDRQPPEDWWIPRAEDSAENLARFHAVFPETKAKLLDEAWVGLRATTPDHRPLAGWVDADTAILTGLGSKGFLYAPLLARCLVAQALGLPVPLESWVWRALDPFRHVPQKV